MADDFRILRLKREERGYTLSKVASDIGVSTSMICKLENGVTSFTKEVVDKLNSYYGIKLVPLKYKCSLTVYTDRKDWYMKINDELKEKNKKLINRINELEKENRKLKLRVNAVEKAVSGNYSMAYRPINKAKESNDI